MIHNLSTFKITLVTSCNCDVTGIDVIFMWHHVNRMTSNFNRFVGGSIIENGDRLIIKKSRPSVSHIWHDFWHVFWQFFFATNIVYSMPRRSIKFAEITTRQKWHNSEIQILKAYPNILLTFWPANLLKSWGLMYAVWYKKPAFRSRPRLGPPYPDRSKFGR